MKVYISPYKYHITFRRFAEYIPFVSEDTALKIVNWLDDSWIGKILDKYNKAFRDTKVSVKLHPSDTWNMDHTLAYIILPMLRQIKESKQGSPLVQNADLPAEMRHGSAEHDDNWVHYRWDYVLNEMIWAFEQIVADNYQDQFVISEGEMDFDSFDDGDDPEAFIEVKWKKPFVIDMEGLKAHEERMHNGTRLFGVYYRNLWN